MPEIIDIDELERKALISMEAIRTLSDSATIECFDLSMQRLPCASAS